MVVTVGEACGSYAILLNGSWYAVWFGKLSKVGFCRLEKAVQYIEDCNRKIVVLMS